MFVENSLEAALKYKEDNLKRFVKYLNYLEITTMKLFPSYIFNLHTFPLPRQRETKSGSCQNIWQTVLGKHDS